MINTYKILVGKPEAKRLLRRHSHRWKDNIKINLEERGLEFNWFGVRSTGEML